MSASESRRAVTINNGRMKSGEGKGREGVRGEGWVGIGQCCQTVKKSRARGDRKGMSDPLSYGVRRSRQGGIGRGGGEYRGGV